MSAPTEQDHFERAREFQAYYQDALREVGVRIPAPILGQSVNDYRRATLQAISKATLQNHELGKVDFSNLKGDVLSNFEPQALAAAGSERTNPRNVPPGQIKPIKALDEYGRVKHTEFVGAYDPKYDTQHSFINDLGRAGRRVVAFMRPLVDTIQMYNSPRGK
jgi:hypothetical protein